MIEQPPVTLLHLVDFFTHFKKVDRMNNPIQSWVVLTLASLVLSQFDPSAADAK